MALPPGTRLGPYEIVSALGAGGMGEVYRARDTKLNRDVAIKVLLPAVANDPDRLARFSREAQALASLNHPNIGHIYGLEDAAGVKALVLELVEGEGLAQRIARGPLPLDEALPIARQIAEALEAAHEQGIIHRDLKPANIKVRPDGTVKVLDFGLAKLTQASGTGLQAPGELGQSPTITSPAMMTGVGVILGTAAYMSPEQAKGHGVDKRSDMWAFGCVLYEMLTGKRAFEGEDVSDTLAAVLRGEPDWEAVPRAVPEHIQLLMKCCLEKDRNARISDIAVARFVMVQTGLRTSARMTEPPQRLWRRAAALGAISGLLAGVAVTATAAWILLRTPAPMPRRPARFALNASGLQALRVQATDRNVDISPDGTFIVYRGAGQGGLQLFIRALGDLDARSLDGSADARSPFISPDGRWVGFFAGLELKKVSVSGGSPITLCRVPTTSRGASWGSDGTIVFATADLNGGLMAVPEGGGEPKVLIKPDPERPDPAGRAYDFPSLLPGGSAVLFTIGSLGGAPGLVDPGKIAVLNRKTGERKALLRGGSQAQYVDGYLVYGSAGSLYAVRFDFDRLIVIGEPVRMIQDVLMTAAGAGKFAVSRNGSLVYIPASAANQVVTPRSFVWVNRQGREEPVALPTRAYADPRLSPDGTRIAVGIRDQRGDIWICDLRRKTLTPLTFDPTLDQAPVWMPDGAHIVWSSQRGTGVPNIYMQAADGTGAVEQLTTSASPLFSTSVSPDARRLVLWENNPRTMQDIVMLDLGPSAGKQERLVQPLVHTPASEMDGEVSADGHWLAYQSNESGRAEVYVRPFPNVDAGRWQVSTSGGTRPLWSRNGRELFYLDATDLLTAVPVRTTDSAFSPGNPVRLLATKYYPGSTGLGLDLRGYDASPDGQRFLMLKDAPPAPSSVQGPPSMVVVLDWVEELKKRVPPK